MKLCKSILSPARPSRDASLSRRLKPGQASPFFTTRKKKGCAFDNPEPSSPKVTCIGQVRVKSSFDVDKVVCSNASTHYQQECAPHHRNQKWVHLPVSICEALSSFSCLFPCKCFSTTHRDSKQRNDSGSGARWLVSLNDPEGGKKREIELVVGVGDEEELVAERVPMKRRHVFQDIEVKDDGIEMKGRGEAARVSICIPPKNALLLMRCRSDPIKMKIAALPAARLSCRDAPAPQTILKDNEEEHEFDDEKRDLEENVSTEEEEEEEEEEENPDESEVEASSKLEQEEKLATAVEEMVQRGIEEALQCECIPDHEEEEVEPSMSSFEALLDQEITEPSENCPVDEDGKDEVEQDIPICQHEATVEEEHQATNDQENNNMIAQAPDPEIVTSRNEEEAKLQKPAAGMPECLLLMMCEPKLSIEVSKETWVCSTNRPRRLSVDSKPKKAAAIIPEVQQPPRSSCTLPAPTSMTAMIEQKLVTAVGYEPFVLTRCKSEPMRTAAIKLGSESFFWKLAQPRLSSALARLELDSKPSRQKMMRAGS